MLGQLQYAKRSRDATREIQDAKPFEGLGAHGATWVGRKVAALAAPRRVAGLAPAPALVSAPGGTITSPGSAFNLGLLMDAN